MQFYNGIVMDRRRLYNINGVDILQEIGIQWEYVFCSKTEPI